jgi:hypothetical protein
VLGDRLSPRSRIDCHRLGRSQAKQSPNPCALFAERRGAGRAVAPRDLAAHGPRSHRA